MLLRAFWRERREGRDACSDKLARLLPAINSALHNDEAWMMSGGVVVDPTISAIYEHMDQHISEVTNLPQEELGWCARFRRGEPRSPTKLEVYCGAWTWLGNNVSLEFPGYLQYDWKSLRLLMWEVQSIYDPLVITASSWQGLRRRVELSQPSPVVDWMVYLAKTIIPAEELPMVHSVERVGAGTLVILKAEPINLEDPADLALVEAVESIIRRHQPDLELKPSPRKPGPT